MRKFLVTVLALLPALSFAATPAEGVPLKVRRGFFTETDIGTFFTVGGLNQYSNAQTYLQLGVGYDVSEALGIGLHFGIGSNAANCFSAIDTRRGECVTADNFTMTFVDVTAAYLIKVRDRLYIAPKLAAGYTSMDPAPVLNADQIGVTAGINVGGGVGVEYATYMDHFSIGADALVRFIAGPNITTIAVFPRVKYTF